MNIYSKIDVFLNFLKKNKIKLCKDCGHYKSAPKTPGLGWCHGQAWEEQGRGHAPYRCACSPACKNYMP